MPGLTWSSRPSACSIRWPDETCGRAAEPLALIPSSHTLGGRASLSCSALARVRRSKRKRQEWVFLTGHVGRESPPPVAEIRPDGNVHTKTRVEWRARHPLQQARAERRQCPQGQGRRQSRRAGRGHRPARPDPEPARPAGARRRGRRDRAVRGHGGRAAPPGLAASRQGEAPGQDARGALRGANRPRHGSRGRLARRERPARAVASAGPVSRVPDVARGARDVGRGDRGRVLRLGPGREAAPEAHQRVGEAAGPLCGGRDQPRAAHGLHDHRGPRPTGAGLGGRPARLQQGAVSHPPHADRGQGIGLGPPGRVRRRGGVSSRRRHDRPRSLRPGPRGLVRGCRAARAPCRREAPGGRGRGHGRGVEVDRDRPATSPTITPMACGACSRPSSL